MNPFRSTRYLIALASCGLIFLLAACGSGGTPSAPVVTTPTTSSTVAAGKTATATVGTAGAPGTTPTAETVATTVPMPGVQTSCPAAGTARAAITAPLALGKHQNVVYLVTTYQGQTSTGTLKRYDVATGNKTVIVTLPGAYISDPQVSADGHWILFVASTNDGLQKIQLIRMDGQGLQTLYCTTSGRTYNMIWSTNQKLVAFDYSSNTQQGLYLLNLANGSIQLELQPSDSGAPLHLKYIGTPLTWLDNTRLYLMFTPEPIAPFDRLGLLDTSRGPNQNMSDLTTVYQDKTSSQFNYPCWNVDSSYDGSTLFAAQCSGISAPNCSGSCSLGTREGPGVINSEPATGGSQHTVLSSQTLGIAVVRAISSNMLLLQVENFSENHSVDSSQNGLWKVRADGTGLTRLNTEVKGTPISLCQFSQNPWSDVSRDGSMYAMATDTSGTYPSTYTLSIASLNGGTLSSFASIADGTQLAIVGWTTIS